MTASVLFPAPHASLISLTRDDSTRPSYVAPRRPRASAAESVLGRVAQGDPRAIRECIDQFGGLIWSIARTVTRNHADAEAAVQEIFADVWRTAARFDPEQGSQEVFITMVARRRLLDRMRRAAQHNRPQSTDASLSWADAGNGATCADASAAGRAVMQLRPELRKVLQLGLLQGMSHAEIADALHLPVATVRTMMTRGLTQVREFMGR